MPIERITLGEFQQLTGYLSLNIVSDVLREQAQRYHLLCQIPGVPVKSLHGSVSSHGIHLDKLMQAAQQQQVDGRGIGSERASEPPENVNECYKGDESLHFWWLIRAENRSFRKFRHNLAIEENYFE